MDGYQRLTAESEFVKMLGPFWGRFLDDGRPEFAFTIEKRHTNSLGICHGGMLLAFADIAMSMAAVFAIGGKRRGKTVSLAEIKLSKSAATGETVTAKTSHDPAIKDKRRLGKMVTVSVILETGAGIKILEGNSDFLMPPEDEKDFDLKNIFK